MEAAATSTPYLGGLQAMIQRNVGRVALIMGALVALVIVLSFAVAHYKGKTVDHFGASGGCGSGACSPGETAVTYEDPDCGAKMTYCRVTDALPGPPTVCGRGWDPAASAEAQALATVGSLAHGSYGERRLMGAVDGAFDSNLGLSDEQLSCLMHQGGAP